MKRTTVQLMKVFTGLVLLELAGLWNCPDLLKYDLSIYNLAVSVLILVVSVLILGVQKGWGLIPSTSLNQLIQKSIEECPSRVLLSFTIVICTLIISATCFH